MSASSQVPRSETSRRTVLAGAAGLAGTMIGPARLAAGAGLITGMGLSGCSDAGDGTAGGSESSPPTTPAGGASGPLATLDDIPVGGGRVFEAAQVVLVRPTADEIRAYSSVCTHAACMLTVLNADRLRCPCHRSEFDTTDGSVLSGPAPRPLPAREVVVEGEEIRLA